MCTDTSDKLLDMDTNLPIGGTMATLNDNETGLPLGECDVSTPQGRADLAKKATEASQFGQARTAQRNQKAKFIQDVANRLGVAVDVWLGGSRKDVADKLRSISTRPDDKYQKYAEMFESGQTAGMSLGGTTFIALDAVQSAFAATTLVLHEVGVHVAVSHAFRNSGEKMERDIIDAVIAVIGRKAAMRRAAGELTRRYNGEARLAPEGEARDAALAAVPERVRKALEGENDEGLRHGMEEVLASVAEKGVYKDPVKRSKLETAVMNIFFKDEAIDERIRNFVAVQQEVSKGDVRFFGYGST